MNIDVKALVAEVQENQTRIQGCVGPHAFEDATPDRKIGKTYRCAKCGGAVNSQAFYWYQTGLQHGGSRS